MKQDKEMMETLKKLPDGGKPKPVRDKVMEWQSKGLSDKDIMEILQLSRMDWFNVVDGCEHLMGATWQRHKLARVLLIEKVVKAFSK